MLMPPKPPRPRKPSNLAEELFHPTVIGNTKEWRRDTARRPIRQDIQIELGDGEEQLFGHTINVSCQAICVNCNKEIEPRTPVKVRLTGTAKWSTAEVIHCTRTFNGYKIGLLMTNQPCTSRDSGSN